MITGEAAVTSEQIIAQFRASAPLGLRNRVMRHLRYLLLGEPMRRYECLLASWRELQPQQLPLGR